MFPISRKVGTPVQMFVYRTGGEGDSNNEPVAFTQGTVTPRWIVNGALFILLSEQTASSAYATANNTTPDPPHQNPLPPGSYRVKVYVDSRGTLADDPTRLLGDEDYVGQIEITEAKWQVGFPKAEFISAADLDAE